MIIKALLAAGCAAVISTSAFAGAKDVTLSLNKHLVLTTPRAGGTFMPGFVHPPASTIIASNLATKYPKGIYFAGEGSTLCGPSCAIGESISVAAGFTPSATVTAKRVEVAVGYIEGTANFTIAIYSDVGGVPGKELWSGVAKKLETFGDCCAIDKVAISGGLKLTGGTQYWLVAEADKKEADTFAAWNLSTTDQVDSVPEAFDDNGTGWQATSTTLPPAYAIYSE
jgi:hypothetical protein